ncbi:MAG: GntR family transcriptional regulator [Pseudorhodoplanes sp.]|nr:GntR family transcriptional regulator [Pseudorhodoplanes sp.]
MTLIDLGQKQGETLTSAVFDALRRAVITGEFAPGEKLRVRQLAERFGTGLSPIREALNRLLRDGLVEQSDLRGFSVAPTTEADLDELTKARIWANEKALRESIAHGDAAWEESVLIAYHRLSRIEARLESSPPDIDPAWDAAHATFHRQLTAACGSRWLIGFCTQLFDLADRYRHLSRLAPQAGMRRRNDEHRMIMEATVARDADKAAALLSEHFLTTARLSRAALHQVAAEKRPRARRSRT